MGRPGRIISDKSTAFSGPKWDEFLSTFDLEYISPSAITPHENGLVGRAVSLIKIGYEEIKRARAGISHGRATAWARMSKNATSMVSSGISTTQEMLGRSNVLQSLENRHLWKKEQRDEFPTSMQSQLQSMLEARNAIILKDASRIVKIGTSRPLRSAAISDFKVGDRVILYMMDPRIKQNLRTPGFRVVGLTSHHVIVERGRRLLKYPKRKTRTNREPIATALVPQEQPFGPESDAMDLSVVSCCKDHSSEPNCQEIFNLQAVAAECRTGKWMSIFTCFAENSLADTIMLSGVKDAPNGTRQDEDVILSGADLNRITPNYFPQLQKYRESAAKEIAGLLKINRGQTALELFRGDDPKWRRNRGIFSMFVVKRKSTLGFKSRLVLRGDTISGSDVSFASAPTAGRCSVFAVLSMATIHQMSISMIDISHAFLLIDELPKEGKVVTAAPSYVCLPRIENLKRCGETGMPLVTEQDIDLVDWETYSKWAVDAKKPRFDACLLTHSPIYGGSGAPLLCF